MFLLSTHHKCFCCSLPSQYRGYLPYIFSFTLACGFCLSVMQPLPAAHEGGRASSVCRTGWVRPPLAPGLLCLLQVHWTPSGHDILLEEGKAILWPSLRRQRETTLWRLWWGTVIRKGRARPIQPASCKHRKCCEYNTPKNQRALSFSFLLTQVI